MDHIKEFKLLKITLKNKFKFLIQNMQQYY